MRPPEAAAAQSPLERGWSEVSRAGSTLTRGAVRLADRPLAVLATLVAIQWLALLVFALSVRHNGLVFYQGGDQINYTTNAWLLGNGRLPPAILGYGWPVLLLPFGWLAESDYVSFLPATIGLNVLVLGPIALACVYALAARIGGRLLGLWAAALWVAAPYLAIPFFREDYHDRYVEQFLPQALGLTVLADFPSMVCLLVAAWLLVRSLDAERLCVSETQASFDWTNAALAGFAAGSAIAIKPANVLFLLGPVLLVLLARHFRLVLPYAAGLAPPLLLLLLWKVRGLGDLPVFAFEQTRLAAGATLGTTVGASVDIGRYVDLDWQNFRSNMANLREFFWSVRVLQWLPFAGVLAVARRSLPAAGLLAGWFAAFLVFKGTPAQSTVESGSFFRLLMPAYPAYFLLAAAIPLLVPGVVRRIQERPAKPSPISRRVLAAVGAVFVVLPLLAIAIPRPLSRDSPDAISIGSILTPVDGSIDVAVAADGAARTLTWSHRDFGATEVFYRVFRTAAAGADFDCLAGGSPDCRLQMLPLGSTREARFTDGSPPEGALYRVGVATNWQNDADGGDVIALSTPVAATP
ncbi:MAG: hypothetical protein MSC30_20215 [Gaiellaceae bacterium MAG52_C11]|nr:hypothetical protein [Candidatus Gaiellasilicea maunaloa]